MKEIEALLKAYKIPYQPQALAKGIETNFEAKQEIAKIMGLSEANKWKMEIQMPTTVDNRPLAYGLLKEIEMLSKKEYTIIDLSFMKKGKNKIRIGKIIPEFYVELSKRSTPNYFHKIQELAKIQEGDPTETSIQRFSCFYGDYIKNGRVCFVSIDPIDFFTLSGERCTFTSCIKLGGQYFNTVLSYLNSANTIPAYITESSKKGIKIGRTMCFVSEDIVATGRLYGNIYEADTQIIRDRFQEKIGGKWTLKTDWKIRDITKKEEGNQIYIDYDYGEVSIKSKDFKKISLARPMCLACHEKETYRGLQGICKPCHITSIADRRITCAICRTAHLGKEMHHFIKGADGGTTICHECGKSSIIKCEHCNDPIYKNSGVYRTINSGLPGKKLVCNDCINDIKGIFGCNNCNEYFTNEYASDKTIYKYCKKCFDSFINAYYNENNRTGDIFLCKECGKYYFKKDMKTIGKNAICKKCDTAHAMHQGSYYKTDYRGEQC